VRIRGVAVGSVLNVKPSLDKVDVLVEVRSNAWCNSVFYTPAGPGRLAAEKLTVPRQHTFAGL
jgi:hypothetical protein